MNSSISLTIWIIHQQANACKVDVGGMPSQLILILYKDFFYFPIFWRNKTRERAKKVLHKS